MASQNTSSAKSSNQSRVREALTGGSNVKEKGPPVADGFLSVTPDTPDVLEWRSKSLDIAETSSTYLDDEDDGERVTSHRVARGCRCAARRLGLHATSQQAAKPSLLHPQAPSLMSCTGSSPGR
jgi:hypothetical protein